MVAGTVIHAPKKEEKLYWCEKDMERLAFYHTILQVFISRLK